MFPAVGLQTYIWNNRLKSALLLAGFPVLLLIVTFGFAVLISAFANPSVADGILDAVDLLPRLVPVAVAGSLIWFVIAWFANQRIVDAITGARPLARQDDPRLYNLLENLAISRGLPMPALRVIETDQRNAFASGVRSGRYSVTVTRGLIDELDDRELAAVLGHELTHIRNGDVQLLIVSAVFVGVISLAGELILRAPRLIFVDWGGGRDSRQRSSGRDKGGGGFVLVLIAIAIFVIARLLAVLLQFALSRKREFLADAGAVELTKDADAMILALRKIEGRAEIKAPSQIREMFLENAHGGGAARLFFTHPTIDARVAALVRYSGGHDPGRLDNAPPPASPAIEAGAKSSDDRPESGPWAANSGPEQSAATETASVAPLAASAASVSETAPGPWSDAASPPNGDTSSTPSSDPTPSGASSSGD
ncbi:MAG: M48 family metalloprotease [Bauldia sp.]